MPLATLIPMKLQTIRFRHFGSVMAGVVVLCALMSPCFAVAQEFVRPPEPKDPPPKLSPPEPADEPPARPDLYGDALPEGAIARLGSLKSAGKDKPPRGHLETVYLAVFSPDGKLVASRDHYQTIRVWEVDTGKTRWVLEGHEFRIRSMVFSPDSKLLVSASWNEVVRLWDVATGREVRKLDGGGLIVQFSKDGKVLTVLHGEGKFSRYDVATGKITSSSEVQGTKVPLAISADGEYVAATDKVADKIVGYAQLKKDAQRRLFKGAREYPTTACFSRDGMTLAAGGRDNLIHVWDVVTGKLNYQLEAHEAKILQIAFSPDRSIIATASLDDTVRLWETISGTEIVTLSAHARQAQTKGLQGNVCTVDFSPDGQRLVSGSADRTLLVWDVNAVTSRDTLAPDSIDEAKLAKLWEDLADKDGRVGYRAKASLAGVGGRLAKFATRELSGTLIESKTDLITRLIEDLDSEEFIVREKATRQLLKLRGVADALLRKALVETNSQETKFRIEKILRTNPPPVKIELADKLRMVRLVKALEQSGEKQCVALLVTLSKSHPAPIIQGEALRALGRLGHEVKKDE